MFSRLFCLLSVLATAPVLSQMNNIQRSEFSSQESKCEPIRIQTCNGLPYNKTMFPNMFNMMSQDEAGIEAGQFFPLIKVKCSPTLQLFLCVMYFPVCNILHKPLRPCKSLCEQNRRGCAPLMRKFGFEWPARMNCEQFDTSENDKLCIKENLTSSGDTTKPPGGERTTTRTMCPAKLRVPDGARYQIVAFKDKISNCGINCDGYYFATSDKRRFAHLWIGLWSIIGTVSTLFTVLTFLIDVGRFRYPERPIIFLSACYFMISAVYVAGFILKDRVACASYELQTGSGGPAQVNRVVTQGTRRVEGCTILFMLLYFFSMASSIWWVILCFTWYLAAGFHWAHEAIAQNSQYFHFVAWALPAAKTIILLAFGKVDGDPLSGVCYTGLSDVTFLRAFLIAPQCVYLCLGTGFLIAGFVSLLRIRTLMKSEGGKTERFEILCLRIGIFSVLYIVPAVVVIGCQVYESTQQSKWTGTLVRRACQKDQTGSCEAPPSDTTLAPDVEPVFEVFMIKYLMSLIVGITCSFWVWSGKTITSWSDFISGKRVRNNNNANAGGGGGGASAAQSGAMIPVRYTRGQPQPGPSQQPHYPNQHPAMHHQEKAPLSSNPSSSQYQQVFDWSSQSRPGGQASNQAGMSVV